MHIAWIAILPVALITIGFAIFLIYLVLRNNQDSHKMIDPKPTNSIKKDELL